MPPCRSVAKEKEGVVEEGKGCTTVCQPPACLDYHCSGCRSITPPTHRPPSTLQQESEWLQREIKSRTDLLAKVRDDNAQVSADIANDRRSRKRLSQQQSETADMPQVLDYVSQKAELYELQDALANWERKVCVFNTLLSTRTSPSCSTKHTRTRASPSCSRLTLTLTLTPRWRSWRWPPRGRGRCGGYSRRASQRA